MPIQPERSDTKTRTLSLRITDAECKRIREIARRLNASEAAVIRYAIRSMLKRNGALADPDSSGCSLIPLFVEHGPELISYFDLDATHLNQIINGAAAENATADDDTQQHVDAADLALLATTRLGETHIHAKLREMHLLGIEQGDAAATLRGYFYRKYIYQTRTSGAADRVAKVLKEAGISAE